MDVVELNMHAEKVANRLGVHAGVKEVQMERSDANPGGPRIELTVYRDEKSQPQRKTFAPDTPDLKARIEQEIPLLAK